MSTGDDLMMRRAFRDYERLLVLLDGMDRLVDSARCLLHSAPPLVRHGQTLAGIVSDLAECVGEVRSAVLRLTRQPADDDVI